MVSQQTDFILKENDFKRNMLTLVMLENDLNDEILQIHSHLLKGRHFYISILIIMKAQNDFEKILKILKHLYREKFVNADVYYRNASSQQNEVFGYDTFPEFQVVNKTALAGNVKKFYSKLIDKTDLKGYVFKTPLMQDPPRVIQYENSIGMPRIQGITYNIMKMTLEYLNGTLAISQGSEFNRSSIVDMKYVLDQVRNKHVELAGHAYALFDTDAEIQKSYPISVVSWCLMVPIFNKELRTLYPFIPFESTVWLALLFTFVIINAVCYGFLRLHHMDTDKFILINFCKFINTPPPPPKQNPTELWFDMILNGFVYIQSFFLSAFYTSILGSFLAVNIVRNQINSIKDLIELQLPVMIIDYEMEFLLNAEFSLPLNFVRLIKPVNSSTFYQHQLNLNRSFAYFTTYDMWHFLNLQQQHMNTPLFRYTDICFGSYHLSFPMIVESPLSRDVEYLMYRIHSSGLYFYHEKMSFEYALRAGLVHYRHIYSTFQTVGYNHLKLIWGMLLVGLFVALLRFLYELWLERKAKSKLLKV